MTIPEGWKLVPVKPTFEMLNARHAIPMEESTPQGRWKAMLSAAPTPPATEWCEKCGCGNDKYGYAHTALCPTKTPTPLAQPCVHPYKSHQCLDCGMVIEHAHTSPSHKAEWDADGNPLNLEAAVRDAVKHNFDANMRSGFIDNLRKFLPEGK